MEKQKRPPLPIDASPQEKYDNLILTFFEEWQEFTGETVRFHSDDTKVIKNNSAQKTKANVVEIYGVNRLVNHLGFYTLEEFNLVLNALIENDLLKKIGDAFLKDDDQKDHIVPKRLKITFSGLKYCRSLLESGKNSMRCFVAMRFSDDMVEFYEKGITEAIEENGFRPFRVDREHAENEQTINDFIIASIKQSRFCVADLTHKSHGAYFEAGYALGRGLTVIYTCRDDHFDDVHFDLKNMQIIKYDTPERLRDALSLKIQAKIL